LQPQASLQEEDQSVTQIKKRDEMFSGLSNTTLKNSATFVGIKKNESPLEKEESPNKQGDNRNYIII
jgi:hypothetical protein